LDDTHHTYHVKQKKNKQTKPLAMGLIQNWAHVQPHLVWALIPLNPGDLARQQEELFAKGETKGKK
jgi:hypothetical protein